MPAAIDSFSDFPDTAGDACGSFIVDYHHCLEFVVLVRG